VTAPTAPSAGDSGDDSFGFLVGTWDISMRTPIGTMRAALVFSVDDGTLTGRAEGKAEQVPLRDLHVGPGDEGADVTWAQTVTRPMRLELAFAVTVLGDQMAGYSRAGRLPQSSVSGARRPD